MDAAALREVFERGLRRRVELAITDNRSTVLRSIPRRDGSVAVRLHQIFLEAPRPVLEAAAAWLGRGGRRRAAVVDRFVEETLPARACPPPPPPGARGAVHDLGAILERLRHEHFGGELECSVGWARPGRARVPRSIKFGSYDAPTRTIRIHPALDRTFVPEGFVAFILHHEMLHAALPALRGGDGRRRHHHAAFRGRERAFPERARWEAWEKENLGRLLREARPARLRTAPPPRRPERGAQLLFAF